MLGEQQQLHRAVRCLHEQVRRHHAADLAGARGGHGQQPVQSRARLRHRRANLVLAGAFVAHHHDAAFAMRVLHQLGEQGVASQVQPGAAGERQRHQHAGRERVPARGRAGSCASSQGLR